MNSWTLKITYVSSGNKSLKPDNARVYVNLLDGIMHMFPMWSRI